MTGDELDDAMTQVTDSDPKRDESRTGTTTPQALALEGTGPDSRTASIQARPNDIELIRQSIEALSKGVGEATRRLRALEEAPIPNSPRYHFVVPVVLLLTLIVVLIAGLWQVIEQSHGDFGKGIEIATLGYSQGENATAMARRIFLLASGHQIITFKAAAFVISVLMFFVGAVFVLYRAEARYDLSTESSSLKASLSTSSPGLVIITLAAALAIATLYSKSNVSDHSDFDLGDVGPTKSATPTAVPSSTVPAVDRAAEKDLDQRIDEVLGGKSPASADSRKDGDQ